MSVAEIYAALAEISKSEQRHPRQQQHQLRPTSHQHHHHRRQAAVQLYYVNGGHKTAYLWDAGPLCGQAAAIQAVLVALRRRGLVDDALRVCRLHDDVLVVNRRALAVVELEAICFVDVSGGGLSRAVPRIVTAQLDGGERLLELRHKCEEVRQQICGTADDGGNSVIELQTDACVPTIFGWLVGYPICYWYAQTSADDTNGGTTDDNCLGGETLRVFQLWHTDADRRVDGGGSGTARMETAVFSMSCAERLLKTRRRSDDAEEDNNADDASEEDECFTSLAVRTEDWFKRRASESGLRFSLLRNVRLERVVL